MRRRTLVAGAVMSAVVVSGATAAVIGLSAARQGDAADAKDLPAQTAEVTRTTLRDTVTTEGSLGYGDTVAVGASGPGTITWLAPAGSTVKRGKPLFKVDERPVVALFGKLPVYRELSTGVEGDDVQQLERNLAKLGYRSASGFTVDDEFTAATADAVSDWQEDLGLAETGRVEPGQVVFVPEEVRIAEHSAQVGAAAGQGAVLSYTGVTREVTVEADPADQRLVRKGASVSVAVPGGKTVPGKVSEVGTVASAADSGSDQAPQGEDSSVSEETVLEVTVSIADQDKLGSLDGGPVDVTFTSETRQNVLTVPVAALLALAEGGYGVEVVDGNATRVVAVDTGLFADGLVEVSGDGIAEGTVVGVAA